MSDFIYKLPNNGVGNNGSGSQYGGSSTSSGGAAIDNSTSNSSSGGLNEQQVRDIVNSVKNTMTETRVREIVNGMQKFLTGQNIMVDGIQKSQNFATGQLGWQIDAEGNAEFNNGTFRGTFILGGSLITVTDIADLQPAIDALELLGGGTASLVPDTYTATSGFTVPSGVTIDGNGSTIDFGGGAYQFLIQGSNAYSTGTVAVNFGSANVVGTGTTWTAGMVGQSILIGDYWYTILTRIDNTHITIQYSDGNGFMGINVSGASYVIATTVDAASVKNLTLTNSSTTLLKFRYCNGFTMDTFGATNAAQGIDGDDSANTNLLNGSFVDDCTVGVTYNNVLFCVIDNVLISNILGGTGMDLNGVTNTAIGAISIQAVTGVGLKFTNCSNLGFANYSIIECTSHGIECVSGNSDIDIESGYTNTVGGDGLKLTASSDRITISSQVFLNYTGYGINIAASSCDNNVIISPSYGGGGSGTLNDSGTGTIIIVDDTAYGASWNGNLGAPTKNAVYDEIQTVIASIPTTPYFEQNIGTSANETLGSPEFVSGSSSDGSVLIVRVQGNGVMYRFAKDTVTGQYYQTHVITPTLTIPTGDVGSIVVIGNFVYLVTNGGTNIVVSRFAIADLTGEQVMTVPTVACIFASVAWTDGTNLYVNSSTINTTVNKWSVSGTTFSAVTTSSITAYSGSLTAISTFWDGTNVYTAEWIGTNTVTIRKFTAVDGSSFTSSTFLLDNNSDTKAGVVISSIDTNKMYIGNIYSVYNATATMASILHLLPITKP